MSDILTLAELGKLRRGNIADICYYTLASAINNPSLTWALQVADDRQIAGQVLGRLTGDDTVNWGSLGTWDNILDDADARQAVYNSFIGPVLIPSIGIALVATGGGAGTWQRVDPWGDNLSGTQYNLGGSHYTANPGFQLTTETIDGQAMIKVPKIWVKTGAAPVGSDQDGKTVYWMSAKEMPGYHVHPAFMHNESEIDQFWWGAYKAGVASGKLTSVPGVACRVSAAQATMESEAAARNVGGVEGFMLTSYHQLCAIQRLATIEMGTPDSQAAIAAGHTAGSAQVNTDAAAELAASWRGLNGLWGNVTQLMIGWQNDLIESVQTVRIWDRLGNQTFVDAGTNPNLTAAWRYATTLLTTSGTGYDHSDGFLPAATDATASNGSLGAGYYGQTGLMSYRHGGSWSSGADAGLFNVSANNAPSVSHTHYGCRLARVI